MSRKTCFKLKLLQLKKHLKSVVRKSHQETVISLYEILKSVFYPGGIYVREAIPAGKMF